LPDVFYVDLKFLFSQLKESQEDKFFPPLCCSR